MAVLVFHPFHDLNFAYILVTIFYLLKENRWGCSWPQAIPPISPNDTCIPHESVSEHTSEINNLHLPCLFLQEDYVPLETVEEADLVWLVDRLTGHLTQSTHPNLKQAGCLWLLAITKHCTGLSMISLLSLFLFLN